MATQPPSAGATEAGDQNLGSWAGASVVSALFCDAEVSRRTVPSVGTVSLGSSPEVASALAFPVSLGAQSIPRLWL